MVVVGISLGGTPGGRVSVDLCTSEVEDSHVVEGEDTGRARSWAVSGGANKPYISCKKRWNYDLSTQSQIQFRQLIQNQIQSQSLKERLIVNWIQCKFPDVW